MPLVGEVAQLLELLGEFVTLFLQALGLCGAAGGLDVVPELVDEGGHLALQRHHVFHPHPRQGASVVTVQVNQALKRLLLAAG